jgi:rhomboid protease GluP
MENCGVISEGSSAILAGMEPDAGHHEPEEEWPAIRIELVDPNGPPGLSERRARLWALVLDAKALPCRVMRNEYGWQLQVPPQTLDAASRELHLFVQENRNWPPILPPPRPMMENTLSTFSVLLLLATFYNVTHLDVTVLGRHPDWAEIGCAQGAAILRGEWWRLVTALTLHGDWLHLLSNVAIGGLFIVYLCRDLGSGLAWSLLLTSGILGNLANAHAQLPSHSSVGSSTAIFGAVGILGAVSLIRYRHHFRTKWPLPVAAALSLLALLGTEGKNTDLGAHLFGFLFGFVLGLLTEWLLGYFGRPKWLLNALLCLVSLSVVLAAWWYALMFAD